MLVAVDGYVDGYVYGGRSYDIRTVVEDLRRQLPSLRAAVLVPYLNPDVTLDNGPCHTVCWDGLLSSNAGAPLEFDPMPFGHAMWVLYSSGPPGCPRASCRATGASSSSTSSRCCCSPTSGPGSGSSDSPPPAG